MSPFLTSCALITLAEMGDKTQLLAMTFATRYPVRVVLGGVFAATAANHLLAVLMGHSLARIIPLHAVRIAASISFILFGLWTLHKDELHGEDKQSRRSPFWTVCIAFFLAEMGDKTQLATFALAAEFSVIVPVWAGTTTGMLLADAVGIAAGAAIERKVSRKHLRWFTAIAFILFGLLGLL